MKNNTLEEIGKVISGGKKILLFPHVNMDGDTLGSSAALCAALRDVGKECHILIEDEIPENLKFLDNGFCTFDEKIIKEADVSVCIDCGDAGRFAARKAKFEQSPVSICIDHHVTTEFYCMYNYVDSRAAATAEIIYKLLRTMGLQVTKNIGEALYTGISTDTGSFKYSNTTGETHSIVADLYDTGIDASEIAVKLYETVSMGKMLIKSKALNSMVMLAGGQGAITCITQAMLKETGAKMNETDVIIPELRAIAGVEIAAVLKEYDENTVKVSLRSKSKADVAEIAALLGGGGHIRAAGCTIHCTLDEAFSLIQGKMTEELKKYDN